MLRKEDLRQRAELLAAELQEVLGKIQSPTVSPQPSSLFDDDQLVDLDQIAAAVQLSRRSMDRYVKRMPAPVRRGRPGRPSLWLWREIRPWLIEQFNMPRLFENFPRLKD